MSKHNNVSYKNYKDLNKAITSPFYRYHTLVYEKELGGDRIKPNDLIFEVVKKKKKIKDNIPVHVASYILSHAKRHVLEFMNILRLHTDTSAYKLLYMGIYT